MERKENCIWPSFKNICLDDRNLRKVCNVRHATMRFVSKSYRGVKGMKSHLPESSLSPCSTQCHRRGCDDRVMTFSSAVKLSSSGTLEQSLCQFCPQRSSSLGNKVTVVKDTHFRMKCRVGKGVSDMGL